MRLPSGAAIALVFYLVIRAGLLSVGTSTGSISPYGIGATAALAGLFSKQAIDKLKEVFDSLLRTQNGDAQRQDKVGGSFALDSVRPDKLPVGSTNLTVTLTGSGFALELQRPSTAPPGQ